VRCRGKQRGQSERMTPVARDRVISGGEGKNGQQYGESSRCDCGDDSGGPVERQPVDDGEHDSEGTQSRGNDRHGRGHDSVV
jgi:hypothetical protein